MSERMWRRNADRVTNRRAVAAPRLHARARRLPWLLALLSVGCDNDRPVTVVEPIYTDVCKFVECSVHGVCAADEAGNGKCHCLVGHTGSDCSRCEPGFHRDAHDRCISDESCDELPADPCAPHGECASEQGVITCTCANGYEGPRCNLCADGYRWVGSSTCVRTQAPQVPPSLDASADDDGGAPEGGNPDAGTDAGMPDASGPDTGTADGGRSDSGATDSAIPDSALPDSGTRDGGVCPIVTSRESFDAISGFPAAVNTCVTRAELSIGGVLIRSRQGQGTVQLCAGSSITDLATPHIEIEADATRTAELRFSAPTSFVSFKYGAGLQAIAVEVLADGQILRTLELPKKSVQSLEIVLDPPVAALTLRGRTHYLQNVALDDITHRAAQCE